MPAPCSRGPWETPVMAQASLPHSGPGLSSWLLALPGPAQAVGGIWGVNDSWGAHSLPLLSNNSGTRTNSPGSAEGRVLTRPGAQGRGLSGSHWKRRGIQQHSLSPRSVVQRGQGPCEWDDMELRFRRHLLPTALLPESGTWPRGGRCPAGTCHTQGGAGRVLSHPGARTGQRPECFEQTPASPSATASETPKKQAVGSGHSAPAAGRAGPRH